MPDDAHDEMVFIIQHQASAPLMRLTKVLNDDRCMEQPIRALDRTSAIPGAPECGITLGDTLSIKVRHVPTASLTMRPGRTVILSDTGSFPSDLHAAEGLIDRLDADCTLRREAPEDAEKAMTKDEWSAVDILEVVIDNRPWDTPDNHCKSRVT